MKRFTNQIRFTQHTLVISFRSCLKVLLRKYKYVKLRVLRSITILLLLLLYVLGRYINI